MNADFDVDSPTPIPDVPITLAPLDNLDSDDEAGDDQLHGEKNSDEFYGRSLKDRWVLILKGLIDKKLRWDDQTDPDGDSDTGARVLGPREQESLAEIDEHNTAFPTVLHHLAANSRDENWNNLPDTTKVKVVGYLLHKHRERKAKMQETLDSPVLTRAFTNQNDDFIRFVIKNFSSQLPHMLSERDINGANCFHYVFKKHVPEAVDDWIRCKQPSRKGARAYKPITLDLTKTLHYLTFLINSARPECIVAGDGDGNTPMHHAMSYRVARMPTDQYRKLVLKQLIEVGDKWKDPSRQFNNAGQSPYLYFERTKQEFIAQNAQLRAQKSTRSRMTPFMATRPGEQKSKRDPIHETFIYEVARSKDEPSSYMTNVLSKDAQNKRSQRDSHIDTKAVLPSRAILSSLQLELGKDTMWRDSRIPKVTADVGQTPSTRLARRDTDNLTQNTHANANPSTNSSSPVVEVMPSSSGVPDSARSATPNNTDSLAVESKPQGKQTFSSKMSKDRVDATKEDSSITKPEEVKDDYDICVVNAEAVRHQLKLHYIRNKSDLEAKELLYGRVASDRNLYFDATNLKGKTPKELTDLVSMLASPGGFEDILSYVSLPVLAYAADNSDISSSQASESYDANQSRQRGSNSQQKRTMGRSSAVAVLDKLAECGVRKIIRLTVEEDLESPPHTDAAIERAVRGQDSLISENRRRHPRIEVETWDWRKFDLSPDVIRFAWPKVSEVNLYWSGNQTVLRGWASESGIPRLFAESERCLRTVIIHWSPGFETVRRCESLLEELKMQVEKRTKESVDSKTSPGVTVRYKRLATGRTSSTGVENYLGPHAPGNLSTPPEHGWIEAMKKFREAIMTMHGTLQSAQVPGRVKVALIDDGVDLAGLNMYANRVEVSGMSYCTPSRGTSFHNPSWHQSSNKHGTIMANSITRLNPWVLLYAMRIQDDVQVGHQNEVTVRIHAGSAARAIRDAIILKVDIISISWTIRDLAASGQRTLSEQDTEAIESLKAAINSAKEKGILIFCSASDDIKKKGVDTLPYNQARDYIFRIGAADAYGWSDKATEDQRTIDYFLPGNQVADDVNPRLLLKEELKYRDGSSVATALAAGLASLVLYIVNVMKVHYSKQPQNLAKITRYGDQLRRRDGMKKAFDNIITDDNYKDKKFLPVWDLFGSRAKDILDKTKDIGSKWALLDELCTLLAA